MKDLWKTKTFWIGGIGGIATGVGLMFNGEIQLGFAAFWAALTIISGRDAIRKVGALR